MGERRFSLTAFADEISPDLDVQTAELARLGVEGLDLRSVGGTNVMDLTLPQLEGVIEKCHEHGLKVSCVGSPVNKVPYDVMTEAKEFDRLKHACYVAHRLNTKKIRIFSPETHEPELAPKVLDWMRAQVRLAEEEGIVLLHENDAKYWGAYPDNAKRLFDELGGDHFKAAFDFANTVLLGYRPFDDWFPWILPHLDTLHIKDAKDGQVVPAGEGDGQMEQTLRWLIEKGWDGPLTIEPHLQAAGAFGGFSGPQLFERAVEALRSTLSRAGGGA